MRFYITILSILLLSLQSIASVYANDAPWGRAENVNIEYKPEKVVFDLFSGDKTKVSRILSRVAYLYKLYGSDPLEGSIVVVIHGEAIPFFAIEKFKENIEMIKRAQGLTVEAPIEFRMCKAAAKLLNYEAKDIHGFISMVPMADAEIVRLQHEGYAYMQ